jgi:hypothetical protein
MGWSLGARSWAGGVLLIHESEGSWYAAIWVAPKGDVAYMVAANRGDTEAQLAANEVLGAMISNDLAEAE